MGAREARLTDLWPAQTLWITPAGTRVVTRCSLAGWQFELSFLILPPHVFTSEGARPRTPMRSEARRVGTARRSRWSPYH